MINAWDNTADYQRVLAKRFRRQRDEARRVAIALGALACVENLEGGKSTDDIIESWKGQPDDRT